MSSGTERGDSRDRKRIYLLDIKEGEEEDAERRKDSRGVRTGDSKGQTHSQPE